MDRHLLDKAIALAKEAHQNQVDKAGKPYIEHPLRVMDRVDTWEEKIVAILHDAVEDSDLTLTNLQELGFTQEIIDAIDAITKRQTEEYETYIQRVINNKLALKIKIVDIQDNMRSDRIANPTQKDFQRLNKYQTILPRLLESFNSKNKHI